MREHIEILYKLGSYCARHGIRVKKTNLLHSSFNYPAYKIQIGEVPEQSTEVLLCILAHELGHFIDLVNRKYEEVFGIATNQKLLYKAEVRAWRLARDLLKNHGLTNFDKFESERKRCLSFYTYRRKFNEL